MNKLSLRKILFLIAFSFLLLLITKSEVEAVECYCSGSTRICYDQCESYGNPDNKNCVILCTEVGYPYCNTYSSGPSGCRCCDYRWSTSCAYGCSDGSCLPKTCQEDCGSCSSGTRFSPAPANSYVSGSRTCTKTDCGTYDQNCYKCNIGCHDGGYKYDIKPANVKTTYSYTKSDCTTTNICYDCNTGCHSGGTNYSSQPVVSTSITSVTKYTNLDCSTTDTCYACALGCGACTSGTYSSTQPADTYISGSCTYTNSNCTTTSEECYTACPQAKCSDLVTNLPDPWLDTKPAGSYETYYGPVPILGAPAECPQERTKYCYYPNVQPQVVNVQAQGTDTVMGYLSTNHSGTQLNNPVEVIASYSDGDGAADIEAIYVWWSPETSKGSFLTPDRIGTSAGRTINRENFGLMIKRNSSGQWTEVYIPRIIDSSTRTWKLAGTVSGSTNILDQAGAILAEVYGITVTQSGNTVNLEMQMRLEESIINNQYNLWGSVNDKYGFLPFTGQVIIEDSENVYWVDKGKNWNTDMKPPQATAISITNTSETEISVDLSGSNNGDGSGLAYVRLDACRSGGTQTADLITATGTYPLSDCFDGFSTDSAIIDMDEQSSLLRANGSLGGSTTFNIQDYPIQLNGNSDGYITFYVTVIDYGGNYDQLEPYIYGLGDWVVVEDGLVFGREGVNSATRELDGIDWVAPSPLDRFVENETDLTNHVLLGDPSGITNLYELVRASTNYSFNAISFTGVGIDSPYLELMEAYDFKKEALGSNIEEVNVPTTLADKLTNSISGALSDYCTSGAEYCVLNHESGTGTVFNIDSFTCDGKGLIVANVDIEITPNFVNGSDTDSCIILSSGDITIKPGGAGAGSPVGYDRVEAFLVANNTIQIPADSNSDGLYVEGGLTALFDGRSVISERGINFAYVNAYPVIAVKGDSKYGFLSKKLFGSQIDIFQTQVGFKPY